MRIQGRLQSYCWVSFYCLRVIPWPNTLSLSLSATCLSLFYSNPERPGGNQAVAGIWPAQRGLCEGNSNQSFMAGEATERRQSGPRTAGQWVPFRWWARGAVGIHHRGKRGQQTVTTTVFLRYQDCPGVAHYYRIFSFFVLRCCNAIGSNSF